MGVLNNNPRRIFLPSDSSDDDFLNVELENAPPAGEAGGGDPSSVRFHRRRRKVVKNTDIRRGFQLTPKKGRRSQQRCDNERNLLNSSGLDADDANLGWDIALETRLNFRSLFTPTNQVLMDDNSLSTTTAPHESIRPASKAKESHNKSPEEAFSCLSASLRAAMKKHLPLGMLEAVENSITSFFSNYPDADFVACNLSSYERLLAHACSMYYQLCSQSYDDSEHGRVLVIQNANSDFKPMNPSLAQFLRGRKRL